MLVVFGPNHCGFLGESSIIEGADVHFCELTHYNAELLRKHLPYTAPSTLSDRNVTIGLGDRLGIATPGHIQVMKKYNVSPVFAQQSLRELELTGSSYRDMIDSATWAVFQEGYELPWGADGDHLKTVEWVIMALGYGCTMITADLSDYIKNEFGSIEKSCIMEKYAELDEHYRQVMEEKYLNMKLHLDTGDVIQYTKEMLAQIILVYKDAVEHACRLFNAGIKIRSEFDFEISVDETETPTLPQAHIFVALEAKEKGVKFSSLAPRFIGEFQKGIDYIGDAEAFKASFRIHAAIARKLGYRISIHSGSDKFAIFPVVGELTGKRFHLKTSGTNWLEALKIISEKEPLFFRRLYKHALKSFSIARSYYHVTPNFDKLMNIELIDDSQLEDCLMNPDSRQVLHIAYGEILKDNKLKDEIYTVLGKHMKDYWSSLENHIGKHLDLLGCDLKSDL